MRSAELKRGIERVVLGSSRTPHSNQGRDVTVSISACDADCAGANPVALTILFIIFDGPKVAGYRTPKGWLLTVREPLGASLAMRVRIPFA